MRHCAHGLKLCVRNDTYSSRYVHALFARHVDTNTYMDYKQKNAAFLNKLISKENDSMC